jgi:hypothetical protein
MHKLVALYEEIVEALGVRRLAREACARLPAPAGPLLLLGLGKVAAELCEGARDALGPCEAVLAVPKNAPDLDWISAISSGVIRLSVLMERSASEMYCGPSACTRVLTATSCPVTSVSST